MRRASLQATAVVALAAFLAAMPLRAADAVVATPASSPEASHVKPVVAVIKGQPSPLDGVAMPTETFMLYLNTQVALEEANARIAWRDAAMKKLAADAERSWWERNGFWVGTAAGFLASVFVVWEVRQVLAPK